jgi:hypothetical protein
MAFQYQDYTASMVGEILPQCHFVPHKFHMTWPDIKLGLLQQKAGD